MFWGEQAIISKVQLAVWKGLRVLSEMPEDSLAWPGD